MTILALKPSQIRSVSALSLIGNSTGAVGPGESLTPSQVRTLLSLGTADSPSFSGLTLAGHLLFNPTNTYDVGNGTYDPRTVRAATSVLTPLLKSASGTLGINSDDVNPVTIGSSTDGHYFETGGVPNLSFRSSNTVRARVGLSGLFLHPGNGIYFSNTLPNALATSDGCISRSGSGRVAITTGTNWNDGGAYGTLDVATVDRPTAALTLGNATYGVTVPGNAHFGTGSIYTANKPIFIEATGANASTNYAAMEIRATASSQYGPAIYLNGSAQTGGRQWAIEVPGSLNAGSVVGALEFYDLSYGPVMWITPGRVLTMDGAATFSGDISMSKTSAQGYISAFNTAGTYATKIYQSGTTQGFLETRGDCTLFPSNGVASVYPNGVSSSEFRVYATTNNRAVLAYDGTNGILSTSNGALVLSPASSIIGLGGITSAYPAIKRSSTTLAFRLADDSADAPISCAGITASGNVSYAQGLSTGTVTKSANYTTTADDYTVCVTANSIDITLETAVGCTGRVHVIQNSGSGVVTLKTTSSQTISGNASGSLTLSQWDSMTVQSDGANWIII